MKRNLLPLLAAALLAAPLPALAQPDQEAEVRAVITRMFDGMRGGDSAAMRAVMMPDVRLQSALQRPDGQTVLRSDSIDAFLRAVGTPHDQVWDERIHSMEVRIDGPLATVWAEYSFWAGNTFSHCGIDAFQLFRSAEGWKITHIADTRRRTGCRDAPAPTP